MNKSLVLSLSLLTIGLRGHNAETIPASLITEFERNPRAFELYEKMADADQHELCHFFDKFEHLLTRLSEELLTEMSPAVQEFFQNVTGSAQLNMKVAASIDGMKSDDVIGGTLAVNDSSTTDQAEETTTVVTPHEKPSPDVSAHNGTPHAIETHEGAAIAADIAAAVQTVSELI